MTRLFTLLGRFIFGIVVTLTAVIALIEPSFSQSPVGGLPADGPEKKVFEGMLTELKGIVPGEVEIDSPLETRLKEVVNLFSARKIKEVQETLNDLALIDDRIPPKELMLAVMAYAVGDNGSGQRFLEASAVKHAGYPDIYFSFARLALGQGRITDADALADKALNTIKSGAMPFSKVQMDYFKQRYYDVKYQVAKGRGQIDDARKAVLELDKIAPGSATALIANAEIAFEAGDSKTALEFLRKLEEQQAANEAQPAEVLLATWFQQKGKTEEAGQILREAAGQNQDDEKIQLALAQWALNQEDFPGTLLAAKAAEAISGDSNASRELRGKVAFAQGAYTLAENHFRKLSGKNPANFDYANLYALSLAHSTDAKKQAMAVSLGKKIAQVKSNNIVALSTLAYVMMKAGQMDTARNIITQIAQQPNLNKEVTFIVCYYLAQSGQTGQAKQILTKVVNGKGLFLFRGEAKALLEKIELASDGLPTPK